MSRPAALLCCGLVTSALLASMRALTAKRRHYLGRSTRFFLNPFEGFVLFFTRGDAGVNEYGPEPARWRPLLLPGLLLVLWTTLTRVGPLAPLWHCKQSVGPALPVQRLHPFAPAPIALPQLTTLACRQRGANTRWAQLHLLLVRPGCTCQAAASLGATSGTSAVSTPMSDITLRSVDFSCWS